MIKSAGDTRKKGGWNEDGRQNKRNADDGSRYFPHRLQRCLARAHSFFDVALDRFDHDDRIINHQTDGENEPEERKRVDGKAEEREQNKRPDQ